MFNKNKIIEYLRDKFAMSPLESLAYFMQRFGINKADGAQLFEAYDSFLAVLNDADTRTHLENLRAEDSATDDVFEQVGLMSRDFQNSLNGIFFRNSVISHLTEKYGVF